MKFRGVEGQSLSWPSQEKSQMAVHRAKWPIGGPGAREQP